MAIKIKENEVKKMASSRSKIATAKPKEELRTYNVTVPVLKKRKKLEEQKSIKLPEFNFDDFSKLNFDEQTDLFNAIKEVFADLRENGKYMDINSYQSIYFNSLIDVLNLAVTGNVAAMDFLCYAYKKGMENALPVNLTLAHKWGMLAIANGSKLSVDRLRMFLTPIFDYVESSDIDLDLMMTRNEIPDGDAAFFVAETFAGLYNPKMNITLLNMSKEAPASEDSNFQKFLFDANKVRDQILPDLNKYLI